MKVHFILLLVRIATSTASKRLDLVIDGERKELIVSTGDDFWSVAEHVTRGRRVTACNTSFCAQSLIAELLGNEELKVAPRGCPSSVPSSATTRIFVAVPSAANNGERRAWIRETWCRRAQVTPILSGGRAGVHVAFFVGVASSLEIRQTVQAESAIQGDIIVLQDIVDAATNVTTKLLRSLQYFAKLDNYTHYVRVEDDVYLFADRLAAVAARVSSHVVLANLADGMLLTKLKYPRGFCVMVPGFAARALGFAVEAGLGHNIIRSEPNSESELNLRPQGAKGSWLRGHWWCDDEFLGVLLYPWNLAFFHDFRLHDLPGRGPAARPVSHSSIAVNAVQTLHEFLTIHYGNTSGLGVAHTWHRNKSGLIVPIAVDGISLRLLLSADDSCPLDAATQTNELCRQYPNMPNFECENVKTALLAICEDALQDNASSSGDWTLGFAPASSSTPVVNIHSSSCDAPPQPSSSLLLLELISDVSST